MSFECVVEEGIKIIHDGVQVILHSLHGVLLQAEKDLSFPQEVQSAYRHFCIQRRCWVGFFFFLQPVIDVNLVVVHLLPKWVQTLPLIHH